MGARLGPLVAALILLAAAAARADTPADIRLGLAAVGPSASDQGALRAAAANGEPSPGFRLGAALGAWRNAVASLEFDLRNPAGDGDDKEAIGIDCFDERAAFGRLEAARRDLSLEPAQVLMAAQLSGSGLLAGWLARQSTPPRACL